MFERYRKPRSASLSREKGPFTVSLGPESTALENTFGPNLRVRRGSPFVRTHKVGRRIAMDNVPSSPAYGY